MSDGGLGETLEELRRTFDERFARPPDDGTGVDEPLLLLRAGDRIWALQPRETAGLLRCPPITPVPTRAAGFLGLAGVRSTIVAVNDLGVVAGDAEPADRPGWMVLCGPHRDVGLAFDELLGHVEAPPEAFREVEDSEGAARGAEVVELSHGSCPVLSVPRILGRLERRDGESRRGED